MQVAADPANTQPRQARRYTTPPRVPLWETQASPDGRPAAAGTDRPHAAGSPPPTPPPTAAPSAPVNPPDTQPTAALPTVGPASEVNAVGQPLHAQQAAAMDIVAHAAQRLAAVQATPVAAASAPAGARNEDEQAGTLQRATPASGGAGGDADLVTPPGGFQAGQVWLNNVFSPEMPAERPRSVSYSILHLQSGALGCLWSCNKALTSTLHVAAECSCKGLVVSLQHHPLCCLPALHSHSRQGNAQRGACEQ